MFGEEVRYVHTPAPRSVVITLDPLCLIRPGNTTSPTTADAASTRVPKDDVHFQHDALAHGIWISATPIKPRTAGSTAMQSGRERTVSSTSREQSLKAVDGRKQDVVPAPEQRRTRNSKDTHSVPAYLEIPTAAGGLENSVWNWETPLEDIGEAESYYYEPQGELLQAVPKAKYTGRDELDPSCDGVRQTQELRHTLSSAVTNTPHADNSTDRRQPSTAPPTVAGVKRKSTSDNSPAGAPSDPKERRVSFAMSETGDESGPSTGPLAPTMGTRSQSARSGTSATESRPTAGEAGTGRKRTATDPGATMALPARKVFPIQIGDKLFRLSGASISSDGEFRVLIDALWPLADILISSLLLLAILRRAAPTDRGRRQCQNAVHRP